MNTPKIQIRYLRPLLVAGLLLLGLGTYAAILLLRQQSTTTAALHEHRAKRRAAADLRENSIDLLGLLRSDVERVDSIHDRIDKHLQEIRTYTDVAADHAADRLFDSYERYFELWKRVHESGLDRQNRLQQAADFLAGDTLPLCQEFVDIATRELKRSEEDYRDSMLCLAWGIFGVGLLAAMAGLFFGYGVARTLSRTIRHLQIRLQDASGKIGPELPEIVVLGDGDLSRLDGQMQELMNRVELLVERLQQREREVLRAEQLAAVGQLAAGVAHEIRNPLTSIKMLVQAGREDRDGLAPEDLEVIERETMRMEQSLKVFLDFARLPKPERSEQDLTAIATRTFDLIRGRSTKQRVELRLVRPASPVLIEADGEQIQQILVNLSLNALDVMPSGGTLELMIKPLSNHLEVSVRDTGPGIAPELLPRLFEPFVSTKETGLGLGLVISRRIAEEHSGRLRVANASGGGACFVLDLPYGNIESF